MRHSAAAIAILAISVAACTASPGVTPSPSRMSEAREPMQPGTHVVDNASIPLASQHRITFSVPKGWFNEFGSVEKDDLKVGFWTIANTYRDPCKWIGTTLDPPLGPTVGDLVTALDQQVGTNATRPTAVTVGGYAGQRIELDWPVVDRSRCDKGDYRLWIAPGPGDPSRSMSLGTHSVLWILDLDGIRLVIEGNHLPGAHAAEHRAELQALIDSIRID